MENKYWLDLSEMDFWNLFGPLAQVVPEDFWGFWIPAMLCKNGVKDINLFCKFLQKGNLSTDSCLKLLMKICQKITNLTLPTLCQGKDD